MTAPKMADFQAKFSYKTKLSSHENPDDGDLCSRFVKKSVLLFRAESERLAAERLLEEAKSLIEVQKKSIVL